MQLDGRHPGTVGIYRYFAYSHLPKHLQAISKPCHDLAEAMIDALPDGPELTAGLRKLLESKDCFVRAALDVPIPERAGSPDCPNAFAHGNPFRYCACGWTEATPAGAA
jgi:hypothetical protein